MSAPLYATNRKALRRWVEERLTLTERPDGGIDARFVYDGSTCSNMGRALRFMYYVSLGTREEGYPIISGTCEPDPASDGYRFMCSFRETAGEIMDTIAAETPLVGRPLADVLAWPRPAIAPSCYCQDENRMHKWGLVLETLHFAIAMRDEEPVST